MILHHLFAGGDQFFPSRQRGRVDVHLLEQVGAVVEHHRAERLRHAVGLALIGEQTLAALGDVFVELGLFDPITQLVERYLPRKERPKEHLVELHHVWWVDAGLDRDGQFLRHLAEAKGLHLGFKIFVDLLLVQLDHVLVVELVLKGTDPDINRLGLH